MQSLFVDKFYEMDPQFEDLLPDGTFLEEGMVVLLEDSGFRGDPSRGNAGFMGEYEAEKSRECNRWCTVTHLRVIPRADTPSPLITFVAVYGDGTKKKRKYDSSFAWLVKLDSIPNNSSGRG